GKGTLRRMIDEANANNLDDTIVFDPVTFSVPQTIVLNSELRIGPDNASGSRRSLTIIAPGANLLTIDAGGRSRIFYIAQDSTGGIRRLSLTGGIGVSTF